MIVEYQPFAPHGTIDLLTQTIGQTEALVSSVEASIAETKRNWSLP